MTGGAESADLAALIEWIARGKWHAALEGNSLSEDEIICVSGDDWHQFMPEAATALEALAADVAGLRSALTQLMDWPTSNHAINEAREALSSPSSERWRAERRVIETAEAWYYADEPLDKLAVALDALAALPSSEHHAR